LPALLLAGQAYAALGDHAQAVKHLAQVCSEEDGGAQDRRQVGDAVL
jgi:hypothetical protein